MLCFVGNRRKWLFNTMLGPQVHELQKEYGGGGEDSEPIRPLAHILLEAKQAKDEAFQQQWKQMKQGSSA